MIGPAGVLGRNYNLIAGSSEFKALGHIVKVPSLQYILPPRKIVLCGNQQSIHRLNFLNSLFQLIYSFESILQKLIQIVEIPTAIPVPHHTISGKFLRPYHTHDTNYLIRAKYLQQLRDKFTTHNECVLVQINLVFGICTVHCFIIACRHGFCIIDHKDIRLHTLRHIQSVQIKDTFFQKLLIIATDDETNLVFIYYTHDHSIPSSFSIR